RRTRRCTPPSIAPSATSAATARLPSAPSRPWGCANASWSTWIRAARWHRSATGFCCAARCRPSARSWPGTGSWCLVPAGSIRFCCIRPVSRYSRCGTRWGSRADSCGETLQHDWGERGPDLRRSVARIALAAWQSPGLQQRRRHHPRCRRPHASRRDSISRLFRVHESGQLLVAGSGIPPLWGKPLRWPPGGIFDFSVECAFLFWFTARRAGKTAGFAAAVLFFAFQATAPEFLLAQHRMDSTALSLVSIALCLEGQRRRQAWYWVTAGVLTVGASVCTPSIALLAPATLGWLLADRPFRRFLIPYICGLCAGSAAFAAALVANGSILPFINHMIWLRRNYSDVNIMPYGSIIGGYGSSLGAATGMDRVVRSLALFCFALPAVLPVVALVAWSLWMLLRRVERQWAAQNGIPYLLACMVMYVGSTYPRADVAHLAFVAALPAVLTDVWIDRYAPRWLTAALLG